MNDDTPALAAVGALATAAARALLEFERSGRAGRVRTTLPHPFSNLSRAEWARSINLWTTHGAPLLAGLAARDCPACGSAASDYIFHSYDAYPYHECQGCRTWFVPLTVTHELFERYFDAVPEARRFGDYTDAQAVDTGAMDADRTRFDGYYAALKACLARGPDIPAATLDVGCGVANSLAVAADHGFAAEGIEVNRHAVKLARELGRTVHFPGEATQAARFDAVTLWETLEHIADPLAALQDAHARLKEDGLLAISVPNLNAPDIRSMRGDSLQIHGGPAWPGHVNLWTPETLALLLRRAGFEPLYMAGQFSTNLEELLAYQLGHWSGARDYLRADTPEFELPSAAKALATALSPAVISWQEGFAFAPILFVLARRSDGAAPAGFSAFADATRSARTDALGKAYGLAAKTAPPRRNRGEALDLSEPEWSSDGVHHQGGRLLIDAAGAAPFAYLWRSMSMPLTAGAAIRVRGVLMQGGLSAGLLVSDQWSAQTSIAPPGAFEVILPIATDGPLQLVICNNDTGCGAAVADIDCVELLTAGTWVP